MNALPPARQLAASLAEPLAGLDWAIGGSTLLHQLGLEPAPADLDLVTTPEHFDRAAAVLAARFGPGERPAHPRFRSAHFVRHRAGGVAVELMAGIAVKSNDALVQWRFDPRRIDLVEGLPWMRADDWLALYRLFDRPARVRQLEAHLAAASPFARRAAPRAIAGVHSTKGRP